jgi:hypothetical protein
MLGTKHGGARGLFGRKERKKKEGWTGKYAAPNTTFFLFPLFPSNENLAQHPSQPPTDIGEKQC